jgi:lipopolysaccharide/colanic/teichoic acid biosynthesis glycosyltransferase
MMSIKTAHEYVEDADIPDSASLPFSGGWPVPLRPADRRIAGRHRPARPTSNPPSRQNGMPSMFASTYPTRAANDRGPRMAWKRPLDIALVLIGLPAFLPFFFVIALLIKLTSPGPVFFVQTRIGRHGERFGMIKFRSMYRDAEARRAALLADSDRAGLCFKSRNDPRITPVGRILRRLSLDELPQLVNVLKGDMSLVGPRPALPEEVAEYPARAMGRLATLPGITGLWQVSGRADIGFDDMVELDLAYVRDASLATDLAILRRTVGAVVSGRGAY